jgi:hypothetical protein
VNQPDDDLIARLAAIHGQLDQPPGVILGVVRLPILDPVLAELERLEGGLSPLVLVALERIVALLATGMLGTAPETVNRRERLIEVLRRAERGLLPPLVADDGDPFGVELRSMLESDDALRLALGRVYPLTLGTASPRPSARWLRDAEALVASEDGPSVVEATRRVLAALLRAPIESRPDLLIGGVRLANQRFARGLLWFASLGLEHPAEMLRAVGLRMGTSGRSDAVVRDLALANTCAVLLGESTDSGAAAALASMRSQVTNRNVLKQVDRALAALAARQGTIVDEMVDLSLPTFGLGPDGRLEIAARRGTVVLAVTDSGGVDRMWRSADGADALRPEEALGDDPGAIAEADGVAVAMEAALAEERRRLEDRLGSMRSWLEPAWRARFVNHPVARPFGRRLVWVLDRGASDTLSVLPMGDGFIRADDRPVAHVATSAKLRLWHPADATPAEVAAWRATLTARAMQQPFRQCDREVFHADPDHGPPTADTRFAGRVLDHPRLRGLLRGRGWAVPALGPWDQGDEATGWRAFDDGLRAELRYQAPERVATEARIERARIVAVRFVRTDAPPTAPTTSGVSVPVAAVPRRVFSEALRDVSLAVTVGEVRRD